MKEKGYRKQEKGITLIALIITIIVMLILVAVTVQVTINGGIFEKAGEAVGKTKNSMKEEEQIVDKWVEKIDRIENGPNAPELIEGMIPVEWNAEGKTWVKADANTDDWYEYGTTESTKKWANAVTVKAEGTKETEEENLIAGSKTREQYQEAEAGTSILQEDILGMYVWIPRYAYKIPDENYHTNKAGMIDIKFIGGTKDTINDGQIVEYNAETTKDEEGNSFAKFPEGYVIHPAFNVDTGSGIKRLSGIWVAKFKASSSQTKDNDDNLGEQYGYAGSVDYSIALESTEPKIGKNENEVTVRPNVTPWRRINVKNCYIACTNMVKPNNVQGLTTRADSHLMKDTEWGAVAYLTQSEYGNAQNTEDESSGVWNNSYYEGDGSADGKTHYGTWRTGMVGSTRDDGTATILVKNGEKKINDVDGTITIEYKDTASGNNTVTKTFYEYNTEKGMHGSTTGTIYGVYDMAGGGFEYVSIYRKCNETNIKKISDYFKQSVPIEHKTIYFGESNEQEKLYEANKQIYGNCMWETSNNYTNAGSWNNDASSFMTGSAPFLTRGGNPTDNSGQGLFYFYKLDGQATPSQTFRPVLWNN